jgi:hypothetical protein
MSNKHYELKRGNLLILAELFASVVSFSRWARYFSQQDRVDECVGVYGRGLDRPTDDRNVGVGRKPCRFDSNSTVSCRDLASRQSTCELRDEAPGHKCVLKGAAGHGENFAPVELMPRRRVGFKPKVIGVGVVEAARGQHDSHILHQKMNDWPRPDVTRTMARMRRLWAYLLLIVFAAPAWALTPEQCDDAAQLCIEDCSDEFGTSVRVEMRRKFDACAAKCSRKKQTCLDREFELKKSDLAEGALDRDDDDLDDRPRRKRAKPRSKPAKETDEVPIRKRPKLVADEVEIEKQPRETGDIETPARTSDDAPPLRAEPRQEPPVQRIEAAEPAPPPRPKTEPAVEPPLSKPAEAVRTRPEPAPEVVRAKPEPLPPPPKPEPAPEPPPRAKPETPVKLTPPPTAEAKPAEPPPSETEGFFIPKRRLTKGKDEPKERDEDLRKQ